MIEWLDPDDCSHFPEPHRALSEPNGLLAIGGDLSPARLIQAYRRGIFPWFGPGDPILWWSPDPRAVLFPAQLHVSRSLRKRLRHSGLTTTLDRAFRAVIEQCAAPREPQSGTWLVPEMITAYCRLHDLGLAHSVEVWQGEVLVGGLYGVALGRVFFGESMFSRVDDGSKIALARLCEHLLDRDFALIDCQMMTRHLHSLGAVFLKRADFLTLVAEQTARPRYKHTWDEGQCRPTSAIRLDYFRRTPP